MSRCDLVFAENEEQRGFNLSQPSNPRASISVHIADSKITGQTLDGFVSDDAP